METMAYDEHLASAEPRAAAAAAPHKRRAVAAGTAVGGAVGVGGTPLAGDEGWTTVLGRARTERSFRARICFLYSQHVMTFTVKRRY
jgi:hypothetical protein